VSYWYPGSVSPSLSAVDLELGSGLSVLVGGSGGGKSTLLRLLNGLVPQFHGGRISGSAAVAGLDPMRSPIPRMAARVGLVFQDVETQSVYGTVEREIAFGLENAAVGRAEMHARVDAALSELSIEHLRGRRLTTLSGGERQRVQLAAVLVTRPLLVALDEPTSQLDPEGSDAVLAACRQMAADGRAVIVAEHRLETLLPAADRLLLMEGGHVGPTTREAVTTAFLRHRPGSFASAETAWEMSGVAAGPSAAGPEILAGLFLAGAAGEVVAVVGPNGSGKTTLLRTLAGLIPPLSGTVQRPAGRTAYLPQNPAALLYQPTVRAEVELTLRRTATVGRAAGRAGAPSLAGAPGPAGAPSLAGAPDLVAQMLAAFGLTALADHYPRDLSSGERQRAALAATLAGGPALVLLDEPTRGMDAAARRSLVAAVRSLTESGSAVVVATHDTDLVAEMADRAIELRSGHAVEIRAAGLGPTATPAPALGPAAGPAGAVDAMIGVAAHAAPGAAR
jgi:energy-coupling factor transporter ATP-binding protein EcfA2